MISTFKLQGKDTNILMLSDKVIRFIKKLGVWRTCLENGITGMFPLLTECLNNSEIGLPSIKAVFTVHLNALDSQFETYFRDVSDDSGSGSVHQSPKMFFQGQVWGACASLRPFSANTPGASVWPSTRQMPGPSPSP